VALTTSTRPAALRPSRSLDGEWRFVADPERLHRPDSLPDGEPILVPGAWEAQVSRPYRIVSAWYHRTLDIPPDWAGGRVVVRFGAVMYRCTVFLNGVVVGSHEGGYTSFALDLTPALRSDGELNELAVHVVNPLNGLDEYPAFSVERMTIAEEFEPDIPLSEAPHGKQTWYSSHSGLWQPVSIERTPAVALGGLRITTRLPEEAGGAAHAAVAWTLETLAPDDGVTRTVEVHIEDPDGIEVAVERGPLASPAGGAVEIAIPQPRLWDIGQGWLYRAEARLLEEGRPVDAVSARFGIREVTTDAGRILLNRRPIYLLGALDQDFWPETISTPPSREALDEQLARARELGINLLRCHIKVPDPRYLEAADEAGMLLWCELPNWSRFSSTAAARGVDTLRRMVETMGNHPSVIAWTIINEDWGTQLRYEARDRRWLRNTFDWLKALDPTRLVVDNSACETPTTPNFHVKTDLLDFHLYYLVPDNASRWRTSVEEIARRPAWLWSPHGDAEPTGTEPILLSEFGSWGLPKVDPLLSRRGREPWWFSTGLLYYRPTGVRRRFTAYGLDRIWPSLDDLAEATQWHQFEAFQYQVGQLRRQAAIQGYVVTELADAFWEANGLLDVHRTPKAYHSRLPQVNAPDVIVVDVPRRDVRGGDRLTADLTLSSYGDEPAERGEVRWELDVGGTIRASGTLPIDAWPRATAVGLGEIGVDVPDVPETTDGWLRLAVTDDAGRDRASDAIRIAILPGRTARTAKPLRVHVVDPGGLWAVEEALARRGHSVVDRQSAELLVTTELSADLIRDVEDTGRNALVLVRTRDALKRADDLARRVSVLLRKLPMAGAPGQRSPWEGDWVSSFAWLLPSAFEGLPARNPLDFAYQEVLPDHVLTGYDPARHLDEVTAGMFVGWVHSPAALVWSFPQGRGRITLTTLHVAPESGAVATALLEGLLQAARRDRDAPGLARLEASPVEGHDAGPVGPLG
jgi:hypothetical protein